MKQNSSSQSEEKGRISGSLAWRLLRGETSVDIFNFEPYVWRIDHKDEENKKFGLSYITSKDMYLKNSECVLKNWKAGMYKVQSVFKKDEKDWKMSYLARQGRHFCKNCFLKFKRVAASFHFLNNLIIF